MLAVAGLFVLTATFAWSVPNVVTPEERRLGFEQIFDGRSFDGWTQGGNWVIEGGAMFCRDKGGDVYFARQLVPDDFELRFEWKVAKGVNSGVLYRPGQVEYQVLDDPNSRYGENPRTKAAAIFFCMAPARDVTKPHGEWNEGRIVCKGSIIQHWLNGEKVIDFDYADPRWAHNLALLRIRGTARPFGGDPSARGGFLRLQFHGGHVWYRSLRWRKIPNNEPLICANLAELPMTPEALKIQETRIRVLQSYLKAESARMDEVLELLTRGQVGGRAIHVRD